MEHLSTDAQLCADNDALIDAAIARTLAMMHDITEDVELIAAELGIEYWAAWEIYL